MKRKFVSMLLFICLFTLTFAVYVSADEAADSYELGYTAKVPPEWNENPAARLLYGNGEEERLSVFSSIVVTVHTPCDQEFRAKYPTTWQNEASRAVEDADELMMQKFGIDLVIAKQTAWTGNTYSGDGSQLLGEAWSNQGQSGCKLMIAFTGKTFPYGGWGYVNGRGTLIIDYGYPYTASIVRHEVGHNYGCPDHYNKPNPPVCFMNDPYGQYNSICTACNNTWYANRQAK